METGEATRFSSPAESANVYLLYYQAERSSAEGWVTSLIVGDNPKVE